MATILIVEDDKAINDLIMLNLKLVGNECMQALDAKKAIMALEQNTPDLVLLDVMIPYQDGFSLMEQNIFKDIPVIFLTAKGNTADKVRGLKLGADDYITKPFEAVELLARVEAVLRRTKHINKIFTVENTTIYLDERIAKVNDAIVELTNQEFELLEVLINNRNIALSREKLIELAWGYDYYGDSRTVDVHITKLRKKLHLENQIKTIFRMGYRLEVAR